MLWYGRLFSLYSHLYFEHGMILALTIECGFRVCANIKLLIKRHVNESWNCDSSAHTLAEKSR